MTVKPSKLVVVRANDTVSDVAIWMLTGRGDVRFAILGYYDRVCCYLEQWHFTSRLYILFIYYVQALDWKTIYWS